MRTHKSSMKCRSTRLLPLTVLLAAQLMGGTTLAAATDTAPVAPLPPAVQAKDVVRDGPAQRDGALVPTPRLPAASVATPSSSTSAPAVLPDKFGAAALGRFGQTLLGEVDAHRNVVLSPVSLASALALAHAGAGCATGCEIAALFDGGRAGESTLAVRLPRLLDALGKKSDVPSPLALASRLWLDLRVAPALSPEYANFVARQYHTDGAVVSFDKPDAARDIVNRWTAQRTAGKIKELLGPGSVTETTRAVITDAVHFKSPWAKPFDADLTHPGAFHAPDGVKQTPMMGGERAVAQAVVGDVTVFELPFADDRFSLLIGLPSAGQSLALAEARLSGPQAAGLGAQLKEQTCRFSMPRFSIVAGAQSLKARLEVMGMRQAFSPQADFSALLGETGKQIAIADVFHSATIDIDEQGGEATAATAVTMAAKSFQRSAPPCAVDRPFAFAIVHRPSLAPLFIGRLVDPTAR